MDSTKSQDEPLLQAPAVGQNVIVSPDTLRPQRIQPGQTRTRKWPVLDAGGPPKIDLNAWRFGLEGLIARPMAWNWDEFLTLPRAKVFSDFHRLTRWSRFGNLSEGVSTLALVEKAGGVLPAAKFITIYGYDHGWTTNLPLSDFLAAAALVAVFHDGEPVSTAHGGPARLIVPRLYVWKSAKWIAGVESRETDKSGFCERNGYHMRGDRWKEERFGW
ncbi:MAG: molybdopterin-dependent oxidoreductase [Bryobacteraceae bacterium]